MPFDNSSGNGNGNGNGGDGNGRWYSTEDAVAVLYFLRQAEIECDFYQLIHAKDAFEAMCRIMLLDAEHVRAKLDVGK